MLKLIRESINAAMFSFSDDDRLEYTMTKIQPLFNSLYQEKKHGELMDLDSFGVAWDLMPRSDRYELLYLCYRRFKNAPRLVSGDIVQDSLFGDINASSNIDWSGLSEKQKLSIKEAANSFLVALVMLFSDKNHVESHKGLYVDAIERESKKDFELLTGVAS